MKSLEEKEIALEDYLKSLGSVAVAFSSGVDSTFLLKKAKDVLGDKAVAITINASFFPDRELSEAIEFCKTYKIKQIILEKDVFSIEGFSKNPPDRCYICKKVLFGKIINAAKEVGINEVVEGSNLDDLGDYRPGLKAISELNVKSPLREAGLSKKDIRDLSKKHGLNTWEKPSYACLATRIPYGETITKDKLNMIDKAEQYLMDIGFRQVRVRVHKDMARIEVLEKDIENLLNRDKREKIVLALKNIGFLYVALDLEGYNTGSMNRNVLKNKED